MNQDKDKGFARLVVALGYLTIALFVENYPMILHEFGENQVVYRVYIRIQEIGLVGSALRWRMLAVMLLVGSIMIYRPMKKENLDRSKIWLGFGISILTFFLSGVQAPVSLSGYQFRLALVFPAFLFLMFYTTRLFQVFSFTNMAKEDPFNDQQETYLQTEELINTEHSVNIPYNYRYKKEVRKGWINLVNLFRALLVIGTPGSGKTFAIIAECMAQLLRKRFAMVVYSYKRDDLVKKSYGHMMDAQDQAKKNGDMRPFPTMYRINFDDPRYSNRCNPISAYELKSQPDALDNASTLMKNLNKEWIKKSDYFSKSAISFTGGLIWYLKKISEHQGKKLCTFGHVSILSTINLDYLMPIMMDDSEVRHILVPFRDALERSAMDQLSGQTSTVQISLANMATKEIFYIMSGEEFNLNVNEPNDPKLVTLQNNPDRQEVYSAPLGLYLNNILKRINKPHRVPMAVVIDELPTIFVMMLRNIIDTGRENKIATILGIQSVGQLILDYGRELADVIYDNCANIICGAAKGETAKRLTELFGKIHQEKVSKNTTSNDVSTNLSTQMMELLPKSKIAAMSTGTFAALVADTFENKIKEKKCYGELMPDMESKKRSSKYELPKIREFKNPGFDQEASRIRQLLLNDDLTKLMKALFNEDVDSIDFYHRRIWEAVYKVFGEGQASDEIGQVLKDMKIYNQKNRIISILSKKPEDEISKKKLAKKLQRFISWYIEEALELQQMDRELSKGFDDTIQDIDHLVKSEYERITGKTITSAIFDESKINSDIANAIEGQKKAVDAFMKDFNKGLKEGAFEGLGAMYNEANSKAGPVQGPTQTDTEEYSSFPVEIID